MSLFDIFEGKNAEDFCENISTCMLYGVILFVFLLLLVVSYAR